MENKIFTENKTINNELIINLFSFGYDYGKPKISESNEDIKFIIINIRNLDDVDKNLRENFNGIEIELQKCFINKINNYLFFNEQLNNLITIIDNYNYKIINIWVGCNKGKHRSVAFIELLFQELKKYCNNITINHRDILKVKKLDKNKKKRNKNRQEKYYNKFDNGY